MNSFSIREYVGKMRNVDKGAKCWPFGDSEPSELPPMTVKKFKWWEDEAAVAVRLARDVVPSHVQEMKQTKSSGRAKQRAPKKRSIVELFAVAPPVEPVEDDGEDRDVGDDSINEKNRDGSEKQTNGAGSTKAELKSAKDVIKQDKPLKDAKKKLKKKKGKTNAETSAAKSEELCKPKMGFPLNVSQLLQSPAHRKRCIRTTKSPIKTFKTPAIRKKKLVAKGLERQHKNVQKLKSIHKNRKDGANEPPIRSILKSRTTGVVNKASGKGGLLGATRNKTNRDSEKHVSFSENDDILGSSENFSLMGLPRLHRLCKIFSDVLAASSAMNNTSVNEELPLGIQGLQVQSNSEKDVSVDVENIAVTSSEKHQECDGDKNTTVSEENSFLQPVDLNHDLQTYACLNGIRPDSSNLSPSRPYSHSQQLQVSKHKESLHPRVGTTVDESHCRISGSLSLPSVVGNHASKADTVSSAALTRSSSQQSASCSVSMGVAEDVSQTNRCLSGPQQMGHIAPKYPLTALCSSVGSDEFGQSRIVIDPAEYAHLELPLGPNTLCRNECINENFVGLPLNSQGEFIKDASSKFGLSEMFKMRNPNLLPEPRSCMDQLKMKGKFLGEGMNRKDQLGQLPVQYPSSSRVVTYGSGCIQLHGCGTTQQGQGLRCQCEHVSEASCRLCNESRQSHLYPNMVSDKNQFEGNLNGRFQSAVQPTMRLMGKNVTVGKSNSDCVTFDDGKIWTDKEIITDNKHPYEQLSGQGWVHHPAYGISQGNMVQPFSTPSNFLHSSFVAGRSNLMHFELGPPVVSRDGRRLPFVNEGSLGFITHPRTEFVKVGHQASIRSHPQDVYQHTMLGSTHCKHSQSICFNTTSDAGLRPAFLDQGYLRFGDPCLATTSKSLPQWLVDAAQPSPIQRPCCAPYSNPAALYRPCNLSGTNTSPCPLYPASVISFPSYSIDVSQACGSSGGSGSFPQLSLNYSNSMSGMYPARVKNSKGTKFSCMNYKVPPNASRTRKRSSSKEDGFMKPAKKAALKIPHDLNAPTAQGEKQMEGCTELNSGVNGANMTETNIMSPQVVNSEKDESRITSSSASHKLDHVSKSGPFKLSAGTKHILKPCQALDGDNSRPVHSSEPFAFENSSDSAPLPHKKTGTIYTF